MKKKKYFLTVLIFLFMLSGVFVSCENVNWFADLMQDVAKELSVTFTFNKPDASGEVLTKSYIIGKNPTASEMINDTQQYLLQNLAEHAVVHAFECNTKNSDGSYPDGVVVGADDTVESVSVTMPLTFTPVIHYKYKVEYLFESLTDGVDPICEYTGWFDGVEGTSLNILDSQYDKLFDGFTLDNSITFSPSTISSTEIANGQKKYIRNEYNITFNANGGAFPSGQVNPIPYKFGEPINESSFPHPHREHYRLAGWTPQVPATMPAEDLDLTAMWEGLPVNIAYYDLDMINHSNSEPSMISNINDFPLTHIPGVDTVLPDPVYFLLTGADNVMYFAGWYLKPDGDESFKLEINSDGKYFIPATQEDEVTLYAKWLPKYVYVKPNASSSGTGFESESFVKTIDEAKTLMTGNPYGEEIRVLGTLSNAQDIIDLSDTYGENCGLGVDRNGDNTGDGVIIVPKTQLVNLINPSTVTLNNVMIGKDSETSVIDPYLFFVATGSSLTLDSGCVIRNIKSSANGIIVLNGYITMNSGSSITNCTCNNVIYDINESSSKITINGGRITNCNAVGIYVERESVQTDRLLINSGNISGNTIDIESKDAISLGSADVGKIKLLDPDTYIDIQNNLAAGPFDLSFDSNVEDYVGKQILRSSAGVGIASNKSKFSLPLGYGITDDGKLAKAVNPQIVINNPSTVTEYILGEFIDKSAKISNDAKVRIKITNDAYNNIENWGGSSTAKYVMYQIGGYGDDCYKALIYHDDTNNYYYADLIFKDAVNTETSGSSGRALDDTDIGYKEISVFVTTDPSVQTTTSVTGISEYIFIHK